MLECLRALAMTVRRGKFQGLPLGHKLCTKPLFIENAILRPYDEWFLLLILEKVAVQYKNDPENTNLKCFFSFLSNILVF